MSVNEEIKRLDKRLKAVEGIIGELKGQHFNFMKVMAKESCHMHFNVYLLSQKGDEIGKFAELWGKRLSEAKEEIRSAETIEGVITARDKFTKNMDEYVKATKVDNADKAMEIAHSFIKKYAPVALPLKAKRERDIWLVDIDVGALAVKIAKVKVDARTGDILGYDIPTKARKKE